MKKKLNILIATDAWDPQTNGVVTTLKNLGLSLKEKKHKVSLLTPKEFITIPCPTYPEIRLSINVFQKYLKKKISSDKPRCNSYSNRRAHWLCCKEILRKK